METKGGFCRYRSESPFPPEFHGVLRERCKQCVVLKESPSPQGSSRTNLQILILVLRLQVLVLGFVFELSVLDNNTGSLSRVRRSTRRTNLVLHSSYSRQAVVGT